MSRPRRSRCSPAFAFAALVALLFQILVVQTHVHPGGPIVTLRAVAAVSASPGAPDDTPVCPLCQELAQAGHWFPSVPPLLSAVIVGTAIPVLVAVRTVASVDHPRGWRNRGPPAPALSH